LDSEEEMKNSKVIFQKIEDLKKDNVSKQDEHSEDGIPEDENQNITNKDDMEQEDEISEVENKKDMEQEVEISEEKNQNMTNKDDMEQEDKISEVENKKDMEQEDDISEEEKQHIRYGRESSSEEEKKLNKNRKSKGKPSKRKPRKIKDPNAPKNPRNAWIFFSVEKRKELKEAHPDWDRVKISAELSRRWKRITIEEKMPYDERAEEDKNSYEAEMEDYRNEGGS